MKSKRKFIIIGMFIMLLSFTIGCGGKYKQKEGDFPKKEVSKGTVNFTDVETKDGETFNPDDYKDKNVIITYVNSGCPYCDEQALHFKKLQENNDFELFYIPTNETDLQTISKLNGLGVTEYKILIDRGHVLKRRLNVQTVPTSIIKLAGEDKFEAVVGVIAEEKSDKDTKVFKDYIK